MQKIIKTCPLIKEAIPTSSKWEMDERLLAALVVFQKEDTEAIRKALETVFERQHDSSSIKKGSDSDKALAESLFGISGNQLLFILDDGDLVLFGAWWPWGDGNKISLRIGIFTLNNDTLEKTEISGYLKKSFL